MRHGWFIIPGVQTGDRTLEEQLLGLGPALTEARGKTVLDLGCAEGLVGREFARSGAANVHGVDSLASHLEVAREQCQGLPMTFEQADLNQFAPAQLAQSTIKQYDIVLSLGVAHKLRRPGDCIRYSARSGRAWVLIGACLRGESSGGIFRSKHWPQNTCNAFEIMIEEGFCLHTILARSRGETIHYWRRESAGATN